MRFFPSRRLMIYLIGLILPGFYGLAADFDSAKMPAAQELKQGGDWYCGDAHLNQFEFVNATHLAKFVYQSFLGFHFESDNSDQGIINHVGPSVRQFYADFSQRIFIGRGESVSNSGQRFYQAIRIENGVLRVRGYLLSEKSRVSVNPNSPDSNAARLMIDAKIYSDEMCWSFRSMTDALVVFARRSSLPREKAQAVLQSIRDARNLFEEARSATAEFQRRWSDSTFPMLYNRVNEKIRYRFDDFGQQIGPWIKSFGRLDIAQLQTTSSAILNGLSSFVAAIRNAQLHLADPGFQYSD